jgi:hypothetical protein
MAKLVRHAPRERSAIQTIFTEPDTGPPYRVHADCQLTRRKRHHILVDRAGNVVFRSRWWADILEWLANEGQTHYSVETDRDTYATASARQPLEKVT